MGIYKRKDRDGWRGDIRINGKRITVSGATKREVADKLADARSLANKGEYVYKNNITVVGWIEEWLKGRELELKEQTFIRYRSYFDNHVTPYMENIKLQELTTEQIQQMYVEMFHEKKTGHTEKTYSHATVNSVSAQFKKCLGDAAKKGLIQKNPHEGVRLHKLREPRQAQPFTPEEQQLIVDYCRNAESRLDQAFYLLIATGMRFGEMAALTWADVDLKNKTIDINKTTIEVHGNVSVQYDKTKTRTSMRTIAISNNVATFLEQLKNNLDPNLNYRDLVMPNMRYNLMTNANSNRRLARVCAILDIDIDNPTRSIHSLRHSWATRALEQGIDVKTVSKMLGHKHVATTMDIYQHVLPDLQRETVDKLDNLF